IAASDDAVTGRTGRADVCGNLRVDVSAVASLAAVAAIRNVNCFPVSVAALAAISGNALDTDPVLAVGGAGHGNGYDPAAARDGDVAGIATRAAISANGFARDRLAFAAGAALSA